jgi:hypothetical protein
MEMQYDINFLNIGNSQIVDKGTTIKLPCNVDMYPENFVVMWKKVEPGKSAEDILAMGDTILKSDSRFSVEINREGDKKRVNSCHCPGRGLRRWALRLPIGIK